ncbi:GNAT family N-acetyltransferase [Patescibacteria group bacterium]|nr:GNAT family N-acetyltransferase [Patescibacteria group bacterium]MCL5798234.1 GNAT family N-acetyltransferase [Patescibacteria group bacterium]
MPKISIFQRKLADSEIMLLLSQSPFFPDVGLYAKKTWEGFQNPFIILKDDKFIGVCVVIPLENWLKLGPVIILKEFQGKGYGKRLLSRVVERYRANNLYIGSSNKKVGHIVKGLNFRKISYMGLPGEIKVFLLRQFWERLNLNFIKDAIPKLFRKSGRYRYFIRPAG